MKSVNMLAATGFTLLTLLLTACASHTAEPERLSMRNPASVWCLHRGGQEIQQPAETGSTLYCLLPSGERIEQWALFHRDHPQ